MAEFEISRQSDEIVEMFCEHCYELGNKNQPAEGFCVDCVKYFCATCLRYHQTFLPDHVTQDKDSMPSDVYMEKCEQHPQELVKFYCLSCEETACSTCKTAFHKQCIEVHHLPQLALEFEIKHECSDIENLLDLLEKEVADRELHLSNVRQKNEQCNAATISALRNQKEEVEKIFDNFEQEIGKIHSANINLLDKEEKSKDLLKADIYNLKAEKEELNNSSQKCKVFLKTKHMKQERNQIKEKLRGLKPQHEKEICKFRYQPVGQKLKPKSFGRLITEPPKIVEVINWGLRCTVLLALALYIFSMLMLVTRTTYTTVEKLPNIEVDFKIKQICYLSEHSLLIFEYSKEEVHVYNRKDRKWTGHFLLKGVTDTTRVKDNKVANTISNSVRLWSISSSQSHFSWKSKKEIDVGGNCQFPQYRQGTLFVMCPILEGNSKVINIFDNKGNKLNSFHIGSIIASGMNVSPDGKTISISKFFENSLESYTTKGKVIATYKKDNLKGPWRMTADSIGNLFVCGYISNNIFYISADLTYGYEILNESHGIYHPFSITYNERESILYVSSLYRQSIQAFKIKSKRFP